MPGLFLTFEGIEGSGKTTQAGSLELLLGLEGHVVTRTREPGGTPLAEEIRKLVLRISQEPVSPQTELLLFLAARSQHVSVTIRPALEAGRIVICDRFTDATLAYQGGGRYANEEVLHTLNDWASGGLKPHRTYLLDVPVKLGISRTTKRQGIYGIDRIEREGPVFLESVRQAYLRIAKEDPERVRILDGTLPQKILTDRILSDVKSMITGR